MANTLNSFRGWAVGFIDWLGLMLAMPDGAWHGVSSHPWLATGPQPSRSSLRAILGPCVEGNRCAWGSSVNSIDDCFEHSDAPRRQTDAGADYNAINVMLLNEFLKEHQTVQELKKQVAELTAGLQKVSAQLEVSKAAPQTVLNND